MESIATPMMELASVIIDLSDILTDLGITFSSPQSVRVSLKRLHDLKTEIFFNTLSNRFEIND